MKTAFVHILWAGRPVRIEHRWVARERREAPLIVFLHEGLGSVSMWRDFPDRLCDAVGSRGLVYSRPGYGQSSLRPADEHWEPDFMHRQAQEVLPAMLEALDIDTTAQPPILFGHSDGGSIALLAAAHQPKSVRAVAVMAPHILVEDLSVRSIEAARTAYETTDLRSRLARHQADPDSAFWGWNRIWLDPAFRTWNITGELHTISCPVLALQGLDDEYGTLEQIHGIARRLPQSRLLEIPSCGHSPHRDQPEAVIQAMKDWLAPIAQ